MTSRVPKNFNWHHSIKSYTLFIMRDHPRILLGTITLTLSIATIILCAPRYVLADGRAVQPQQAQRPTTRQYDQRLPPVMPGEEIVTETGQKMRVWSSAGPVPVNPRPTPQPLPGNGVAGGGIGVIVDGRDRYDRGANPQPLAGR
jgi:hypothetical protein